MRRLGFLLAFLGFAVAARASVIPAQPPFQPSGHYVAITATTSGVVATLPCCAPQIVIYNQGDVDAVARLGVASPAPTPSLTGEVVRAHGFLELSIGANTQIAIETASGSAPLLISAGAGIAAAGGAPGVNAFPSTQSISAASLPLPTGAATSALQPALNGDGGALAHITNFPSTQATTTSNGALESGGNLAAINASVNSPIPAGSNVIGAASVNHAIPGITDSFVPADSSYIGTNSCSSACNGTILLGPIDTTGYATLALSMTAVGAGATINMQGSNDQFCQLATNWTNGIAGLLSDPTQLKTVQNLFNLNFIGGGTWFAGPTWHCLRLVFNTYTSGTYTVGGFLRHDRLNGPPFGATVISPIPGFGTQTTASANGTTGAISASMAAVSGKTNWVCHVEITSSGTTTAALFAVTLTGLIGGTSTMEYWAPSAGQGQIVRDYNPCIQGSAVNTDITINIPALGAGTTGVATTIAGYYE